MSCVYRRLAYWAGEDKRAGVRHGIVPAMDVATYGGRHGDISVSSCDG